MYYRQFSTYIKIKTIRLIPLLLARAFLGLAKLIILYFFYFDNRRKLSIYYAINNYSKHATEQIDVLPKTPCNTHFFQNWIQIYLKLNHVDFSHPFISPPPFSLSFLAPQLGFPFNWCSCNNTTYDTVLSRKGGEIGLFIT